MAVKFNPFTGQLQIDEKGSGGGSSYIDGEVQNFSALPETLGSPAVDSAYLCREPEGTWLLNRKPAGIYIRTANTGTRASDWTYAGEFPDVFNDANLVVYNNTDSTKNAKFDASAISTGTTRTISVPDKNITLDDAGDSRTPSSHASSHASAGSDPLAPSDIGAADASHTHVFYLDIQDAILDDPGTCITDIFGNAVEPFNASGKVFGLDESGNPVRYAVSDFAEDSHTHGNITNGGLVGTTANLPLKTGTGGIVEAGVFGTGAGEFSEGNHTHTQLHDKSHTMTDATSHTAGNHKVFYSDGSGEIVELALGNSGEVLTSNGATSAPSFAAASGGVSAVNSTLADILSVSGSDLVADDLGSDKLYGWDDSASKAIGFATVGPTFDGTTLRWPVELVIACSDETSNLTTGTAKVTFRAPYAFLLTGVRASVNTAPTGSTLIVDINNGANSALSTKLSIDASEKTSTTAATAAVIDTTYDDISDDAEITIDIDQIGSTVAGKGLKVTLIGTRA